MDRSLIFAVTLTTLLVIGLPSLGSVEANTGCPDTTSNLGVIALTGTCIIDSGTTWENGTLTIAGDIVVNAPLTMRDVFVVFDVNSDEQYGLFAYSSLVIEGGGVSSATASHYRLRTYSTYDIQGAEFVRGRWDFSPASGTVESSIFRDADNLGIGDVGSIWIGADSTFQNNVLRDISIDEQGAVFMYQISGGTKILGNEFHLDCFGSNCMAIETYDLNDNDVPNLSAFPVVEIAWNNITWENIGSGDWAIGLDNEYSMRLYLHNNTQYNNASEAVGNCLQGGGVYGGSVYENNTCYGETVFGIYVYINGDSGNTYQDNWFEDVHYGGIFEIGNADIRRNTWANVRTAAAYICGDTDYACAGSATDPRNLRFYDNSVTYQSGAYIVRMSDENDQYNLLIQHGNGQATQWTDGSLVHEVPGEGNFLYKADAPIERLRFENLSDGSRKVTMTVNGADYSSTRSDFGAADSASLTLDGVIEQGGSMNINDNQDGTFLWGLGRDYTHIDVSATGQVAFTVVDFFSDTQYNVSLDGTPILSFNTDATGHGSFNLDFGSQHSVEIEGRGAAPPPPPDGLAPAQVTDLEAVAVDSVSAFLQWTAPGDDGILGQADRYDIRYSTAGPIDGATFASATLVPVSVPAPGPSGTTETLNVTGLSSETDYWFALRAADEVPNWSPVSNNVNVTTSSPPDASPPAQVTDLEAVAVNSDYVVLQWRAPGDDGGVGQADAYDVRYSTSGPLDEASFGSASPVPVSVPTPIAAGGIERLNVTGLAPATDYWFALRTADEVPNWSLVSNTVNATTLQNATSLDDTPPTVTITSPDQDAILTGTVVVMVDASDDTSVDEVTILLNGTLATTLSEAPYAWTWSTEASAPGPYTLTAEATDPAGNVGSDEVQVIVLRSITPEPKPPPTVVSLFYDPSESRFDIQFSTPMDHASVSQALSIEPLIAYQTTWADDSNLTVVLQEASQPDLAYTLTIARSAADTEGTPLAEAFAFGFIGISVMEDTGVVPDLWLRVSLLLAAGLVTVAGLHLWSRRGIQRVRRGMRQLASRLEELNNASQERIYQELSELEGLISGTVNATDRRATHLTRAR